MFVFCFQLVTTMHSNMSSHLTICSRSARCKPQTPRVSKQAQASKHQSSINQSIAGVTAAFGLLVPHACRSRSRVRSRSVRPVPLALRLHARCLAPCLALPYLACHAPLPCLALSCRRRPTRFGSFAPELSSRKRERNFRIATRQHPTVHSLPPSITSAM